MGIFGLIKMIREEKKKIDNYLKMSVDDLRGLSDEELKEALWERILAEEDDLEVIECLHKFRGAKRIYYVVNYFDMEVQNGGLCQFFVNSSKDVAPYILKCLRIIDAVSYEKLLKEFVETHKIKLTELESFDIDDIDDYEEQTKRYPFDDFDDAYYELYEREPLEDMLIAYAKQHLEDFAIR